VTPGGRDWANTDLLNAEAARAEEMARARASQPMRSALISLAAFLLVLGVAALVLMLVPVH
jgi:ferric-dicitrate binding protein FerR (iron transport regulator)